VFDPSDPIIQAYEHLFRNSSGLLRKCLPTSAGTRAILKFFFAPSRGLPIFHMRDPQVFYNKEDIWEIAHNLFGQSGQPEPVQPTYVVASFAGGKTARVPSDSAVYSARQR